ncbi:MAG: hypothetical protein WCS75_00190 [Sphingomonas sp.]|jgi:hypothetical protein|uniref:hypothetical protein n=1 Tax=Alphaproteobacteria TaxID=28211 RepID=UPI001AE30B17|nr:hypothetical protein [Sphingomonas sp. BE137]MDR6849978.1 hypothetical protein [Sphingomonas sp. BE137]
MTEMMQIQRILVAAMKAGSPQYVCHCGATLDEVSGLLSGGLVEEAGWAIVIHGNLHWRDRGRLSRALPALISNRFWLDHVGIDPMRAARWCAHNDGWAKTLRDCAFRPPQLAAVARAQAQQIADQPEG